jgi:hypothetical protein
MPINFDTLRLQMTKHEGYMLTPYLCQANKWSVGIGRNLEDVGISQQESRNGVAASPGCRWGLPPSMEFGWNPFRSRPGT